MSTHQEEQSSNSTALTDVLDKWKKSVLDVSQGPSIKSNSNLEEDAKIFFRDFSRNAKVDAGLSVQTRSSSEEALGRLIQEFGDAFMASHAQRLRALHVLLGAIKGCNEADMSNSCVVLLGNFLSSHCGPIIDDEYEEDYDSLIRDVSVQGLIALIETPTSAITGAEFAQALEIRVDLAKKGVERRCAAPEYHVDEAGTRAYGYGMDEGHQDIRGGLSTLPRSKRSLCFDLLRSAVRGVSKVEVQIQSLSIHIDDLDGTILNSVQTHFIDFTSFVTRCIPGESDPRCLMQLLELLHVTQESFHEWFVTARTSRAVFPIEEVFDSVAPYYPIQFTPPPNNVHGITREGLHNELISVLTCTKMDEPARKFHKPTMLSCSFSLFLEQLVPPPDEEIPGMLEKLEALECLSALLFPVQGKGRGECDNLTPDMVGRLSVALRATHDEASIAAGQGGNKREEEKVMADTCRAFVSKIAFELEKSSSPGLWEAFVADPLDKEIRKIQTSPSYTKTFIAYAACLAASGGPRTLRVCLDKTLQPLLDFVGVNWEEESEDTFSAVRGIAAFFSSTQVALAKSQKDGVELSPHPLEPYAATSCDLLLKLLEKKDPSLSWSMQNASILALEFLLVCATEQQLQSGIIVPRIIGYLIHLRDILNFQGQQIEITDEYMTFLHTSSRVLGKILGIAMDKPDRGEGENETLSRSVLFSKEVDECVQNKIYPSLFDSDADGDNEAQEDRFKLNVLATACSANARLAKTTIIACLQQLHTALKRGPTSRAALGLLSKLSYIVRNSNGNNVIIAVHESPVLDDILETLSKYLIHDSPAQMRVSISQIALPQTTQEKEKLVSKIDAVNQIITGILPCYATLVPTTRVMTLLREVSNKIPPLSGTDEADLFVRLPLLNATLQSTSPSTVEEILEETGGSSKNGALILLEGLTDFVLNDQQLTDSRNAAACCVHALVKSGFNKNLDCPAKPLVKVVVDFIAAAPPKVTVLKNCLNFFSLLGSAAAVRGASSSSTADAIAKFLVETACERSATLPYAPESICKLDLSLALETRSEWTSVKVVAASSFGAMLMQEGIRPLMKQRLIHACLKYINVVYEKENDEARNAQSVSEPQIGVLMIVSYVICAGDLMKFDKATINKIATIAVEAFSSEIFQLPLQQDIALASDVIKSKALIVCAALKLVCVVPSVVSGFILTLVSGLLRAYAVSNPDSEVGCKVLALQCLEQVAHIEGAKSAISAVRPAVVAILASAMNQKSGLLRSAAVDVRNAWCLVE